MLRILVPCGALVGVVLLVRRTMSLRGELRSTTPSPDPWTPIPDRPVAVAPAATAAVAPAETPAAGWLPPNEDGSCPPTHPIKAKKASGIYHLPGRGAYQRTKPDRCYADEAGAIADGFTKAKR